MSTAEQEFVIGIPIFDGIDLMDVAAPREVFSWMGSRWKDKGPVKLLMVAERDGVVTTRDGMRVLPDATFAQVTRVDLLWVPGANPDELKQHMENKEFLEHLRKWAKGAGYVTSVCEGALLLAAAGLLDGYRATTHWAFIECLRAYDKIHVVGSAGDLPRFVVDRGTNGGAVRVTGGGISSGFDEALEIVRLLAGEDTAKWVQQVTQYFPKPPVNAPLPDPKGCALPR